MLLKTVSLASCPDYDPRTVSEALAAVLAPLGGIKAFVHPGQRVLLKINLLSKAAPQRAVTTHPEMVRALIREVRGAGGIPVVGDSPGGPNTPTLWRRLAEETRIAALCREEEVELVLFDDDVVRVANPQAELFGSFTLGRAVAEADVLISVPKFKTHGFMMFTGAVKNLFGCIPGLEKAQYHLKVPSRDDFAAMLIDLMLACGPSLAVMDAVIGMEGQGPAGGTPRKIGALIASTDCVALDIVAAAMAGFDSGEVYTNKEAFRRGLGPESVDGINVVGGRWQDLAPDGFSLPHRDAARKMPPWLKDTLGRWLMARPVLARPAECTKCRTCAETCPVDAIEVGSAGLDFDRQRCIRCYCCQELCPRQAIDLRVPPLARLIERRR